MTIKDLSAHEFDPYYGRYITKLSEDVSLRDGFDIGYHQIVSFFNRIPFDKLNYKYEDDKWTIKEVFQHLIDTERIFMYRCFRIARRDSTALAGFDQNVYMDPSGAKHKKIKDLVEEFESLRKSSITMLASLSDENLRYVGNSNGASMSARAAAFTIIGHEIWHIEIVKEKYGIC